MIAGAQEWCKYTGSVTFEDSLKHYKVAVGHRSRMLLK